MIVERISGVLSFGLDNYTATIRETDPEGSVVLQPVASPGVSEFYPE